MIDRKEFPAIGIAIGCAVGAYFAGRQALFAVAVVCPCGARSQRGHEITIGP
jgi:hypothetical protein